MYLFKHSLESTDTLMKSSGNSTPNEDNINVVVRVRPINDKERKAKDESIIQFPGNGQILVDAQKVDGQKPKLFSYNVVFETGCTQEVSNKFMFVQLAQHYLFAGYSRL